MNENSAQTCKRCLYSTDHPLGLILDDAGICSGCRIHEEKDTLCWDERWQLLEQLVQPYRSQSSAQYDCIVPVSGGRDAYFMVHMVKNKLKLNPLLVTYNTYWNTPLGIRNLANLRIQFNCDIVVQNINPLSVKRVVKTTLRKMGSIYWHCIAGQTVFPVQTAIRYQIPLIIWGAHQGLEQSGMFSHAHAAEMTRRYRKDHDLMGMEADDLLSAFDTLSEGDIWQYRYPDDEDIHRVGVRGIYLSNYVRWDPKQQHETMISNYDYHTSIFSRSFDCYDYVECYNYLNLHDELKFYKHGYSKVLDHACREIRHGRLDREQALNLVHHYQHQPVHYRQLFCDWLGIDDHSLQFVMDQHRNPRYWEKDEVGQWHYKSCHSSHPTMTKQTPDVVINKLGFIKNDALSANKQDKYITIGKGWP